MKSSQKIIQSKPSNSQQASAGPDGIAISPNRTGLPDGLKAGVESLSGISLDDVRVHTNSSKPAKLNALAYTQGSDIHVAPGQERHLAHEAWHVVQQAQGRVQPTMQMKGVSINDNTGLEHEADVMGARAVRQTSAPQVVQQKSAAHTSGCGCAACAGATKQMRFDPASTTKTVQLKKCDVCGNEKSACICPSNGGPAPTGNYVNTTGHHDPTKDKSRKKSVARGYTGKRGKKPKS